MTMTLFDMPFDALARDAHYHADFLDLHSGGDAILKIDADGFHHACVVRPIPDSLFADLETPWGYGGPLAADPKTLANGLGQWSESRKKDGHGESKDKEVAHPPPPRSHRLSACVSSSPLPCSLPSVLFRLMTPTRPKFSKPDYFLQILGHMRVTAHISGVWGGIP